ncbi:hypothetical protein PAMP_019058 [Pampus punctatissimus]
METEGACSFQESLVLSGVGQIESSMHVVPQHSSDETAGFPTCVETPFFRLHQFGNEDIHFSIVLKDEYRVPEAHGCSS